MHRKLALVAVSEEHIENLVYQVPDDFTVLLGDLVHVPLRSDVVSGIVIDLIQEDSFTYPIKLILQKIGVSVSPQYLEFLRFASSYYCAPLGASVKIALPSQIKISDLRYTTVNHSHSLPVLSEAQKRALKQLMQITIKNKKPTLLHGITGSGKTSIYMHLAAHFLLESKQVLILSPEIALTSQMVASFKDAFTCSTIVWHSKIKTTQKTKDFQQIVLGTAQIIIGVRSALFLPYKNLGLIIVDEEHDQSYKQESYFCYNARDMAVLRGFLCKTSVLLGSATPSIETYHNVLTGKYENVQLTTRFAGAQLPKVEILNMQNKKSSAWICESMYSKIIMTLQNGNQVLLFLNRRGYAPLVLCSKCGFREKCPFCTTWLVLHKQVSLLKCHQCGHTSCIPEVCKQCSAQKSMIPCGPGVERIEEELKQKFPKYKIAIASRDKPYDKIIDLTLQNFAANQIDILIGTQIITKGHHFPNLMMVGVIDADIGLFGENIRALETTFQLLHQVGGRSGREQNQGTVCIQTYFPNSQFMQLVQKNDFISFINYELEQRKQANLPPFSRAVKILISSHNKTHAEKYANQLRFIVPCENKQIRLLGPVDARIAQINKEHRIRMLLLAEKSFDINSYITNWLKSVKKPSNTKIKIDVDPYDFS